MEPKNETTLAQQCYEQLSQEIIDGSLKPGQKLKMEELRSKLDAGQSPIREALSRLAAGGLVQAIENKGFRVAAISEADVIDTYQTYFQIEALALEQAIKNGDEAWQAHVVATLYQLGLIELKNEPVNYTAWSTKNYNFHVALISGCNSPNLLNLRKEIYQKFDRYCRIAFSTTQQSLEFNHQEHQQIAQAALDRNIPQAISLLRSHILDAMPSVIQTLKKNNLI